jgi:hypothetical protein
MPRVFLPPIIPALHSIQDSWRGLSLVQEFSPALLLTNRARFGVLVPSGTTPR